MSVLTRAGLPKIYNSRKPMKKRPEKVGKVMHEFRVGTLHSGSKKGPKVKSRDQAIAIAMSEAGMSKGKKKMIGHNPAPPYGKNGVYEARGKIGIG